MEPVPVKYKAKMLPSYIQYLCNNWARACAWAEKIPGGLTK